MDNKVIPSLTVLCSAGKLELKILGEINRLAEKYSLSVYCTASRNIRIMDIPEDLFLEVKEDLLAQGADLKAPGKFPRPRICVGKDYCKLGLIDSELLSHKIIDAMAGREKTKGKFKVAISACMLCCSGAKLMDIGIVATTGGLELYVGGKGGPFPKVGQRIGAKLDDEQVVEMIRVLVDYHDANTEKKQRFAKLLGREDFPYPVI